MKLILDEDMPLRAGALLRAAGVEAQHVLELGMGGAGDESVLARAKADGAVVVTLDADFHQILARTRADRPSVIRIRIEGLVGQQLTYLLLNILRQTGDELAAGVAVSVTGKRVRLRRLPLRA